MPEKAKSHRLPLYEYRSPKMTQKPIISIVVPILNHSSSLSTCLGGLNKLKVDAGNSIEVIVVDGGSTDGSLQVLDRFSSAIDLQISEPDRGIYDAMNKGIANSTGGWIYFLGADDEIIISAQKLISLLTNSDTSYYGDVILASNGARFGGKFSKLRLLRQNIPHQAIFYSRRIFDKGVYNLKSRILADWELNISTFSKFNYCYVPEVIAVFNNAGGVSSTETDENFQRIRAQLYRENFGYAYVLLFFVINVIKAIYRFAFRSYR